MPTRENPGTPTDETHAAALAFALADYRWQILSADQSRWTEPDGLRVLTNAFLKYHVAKLALEAHPGTPQVSAPAPNARLTV